MESDRLSLINDAKNNISKYMKKYSTNDGDKESNPLLKMEKQYTKNQDDLSVNSATSLMDNINASKTHANYSDTVNILIMERNNLQMKLKASFNQIEELNNKNNEYEKSKIDLECSLKESKSAVTQLKTENEMLNNKVTQLNESMVFMQQTLTQNEDKINVFEKEGKEMSIKLKNKINECTDLNKTVEQLKLNILDLNKTNKKNVNDENLSERCLKLMQKNQFLQQEIEKKNKDISQLKETFKNVEVKKKELEANLLSNDKSAKEFQLNQLNEINKLKENNNSLFIQVQTLRNKTVEVDKSLPRQNEELRAVIEQKNIIITDLMRKAERVDKLNEDCRSLIQKVQSDRDTISRCTEQNLQLKNTLFDQDKVIKSLQNEKLTCSNDEKETAVKSGELIVKKTELENVSYENHAKISMISEALHSLFELGQQQCYNYKRFNLGTNFHILSSEHESLKESIKDLIVKNEQLKKVNSHLSLTLDEYCCIIKELNHNIVDLKERISFLESDSLSNKHIDENEKDEKKANLIELLNKEKSKLLNEIDELNQKMTEDNNTITPDEIPTFKTESYATLERRFNQIKHEKAIIESQLEEMEHKSIILSHECDTITEYVTLYVNQKIGLKLILDKTFAYLDTIRTDSIHLFNSIVIIDEHIKNLSEKTHNMPNTDKLSKSMQNLHSALRQFLTHITFNDIDASYKFSIANNSLPWIGYMNHVNLNSMIS